MARKKYKYKYYAFDRAYNKSRLTGDIYLASPLQFNDPYDCQIDVINNSVEKDEEDENWLSNKLTQLEYNESDKERIIKGLKSDDQLIVKGVHKKQLEKNGIFCLTANKCNITMWAYYANHTGFCIEYDTDKLTKRIVIEFINKLSLSVTKHLFNVKEYNLEPLERAKKKGRENDYKERINKARKLFPENSEINNIYLKSNKSQTEVLYFIQNIFIKRVFSDLVEYNLDLIDNEKPYLFNRGDNSSLKYYHKLPIWSNEDEYRYFVSLGGRTLINIGKDCIKSVTVGVNISASELFEIVGILNEAGMADVPICKMIKGEKGLESIELDYTQLHKQYEQYAELNKH